MGQQVLKGIGCLNRIATVLNNLKVSKVLLVSSKDVFILSGAEKIWNKRIFSLIEVVYFNEFDVNPKIEDAIKGQKLFINEYCDCIVSIGGGSSIDMAKLIKYFVIQNDISFRTSKIIHICVPTTAGTGSEATSFAVMYENGIKKSIEQNDLLPDIVFLDYSLLKSQSVYQMAVSGVDALAQAIESLWSLKSTSKSRYYALKAIPLIYYNLETAIRDRKNIIALRSIAIGAHYAGRAINISKTTAPHALSYAFTSHFGLPHGHAVALFLPFFIWYHENAQPINCLHPEGISFLRKRIGEIKQIIQTKEINLYIPIYSLIRSIDIDLDFNSLKIKREFFLDLFSEMNLERLNNNPCIVDREVYASVYEFNMSLNKNTSNSNFTKAN